MVKRVNVDSEIKIPHKQVLPFLIKQVLFYIAVLRIGIFNFNQEKVWEELNEELKALNFTISHNFFSRMHTTPRKYVDMKNYKQPKLSTNYMGQKHGELAVAIKNLVYQAGKYDVFCDIFGGSGAASLAVNRHKEAKYVYNEKNMLVYNLFEVLTDNKLHKKLIKELELLQKDIKREGTWLDIDFDTYIKKFNNNKSKDLYYKHKNIIANIPKEFEVSYDEILKCMASFNSFISQKPYEFEFEGRKYTRGNLLEIYNQSILT